MKTLTPLRFVACGALVACGLALAGCSTPQAKRFSTGPDFTGSLTFCVPDRLYLLASPYPRLYVEVDAVQGCVPSQATLEKLRDFLRAYCDKPGGIEIARSDVIPLEAARGISPSALARKYLDGPPENPAAPRAAFIYVLFYKDALCDQIPVPASRRPATDDASPPRVRNWNPHVDIPPYPVMIYMSTHHVGFRHFVGFKWEEKWNLLHEAGHVLGLAFRPDDASAGHCRDWTCLMSGAGRYRYLGLQRRLCERCVAQLAEASRQPPCTNLNFVGPLLVRSEGGYHVLSLPHRERVIVGALAEKDCREFAAAIRAETPIPGDDETEQRADGVLKEEALREPERMREIFGRAKADPDELVRTVASRWWAQALSQWHYARGEFRDAVNICREAVRVNPQDDWSYNQLAWIKAACPEPSVRDGKEAVAAATKACELTEWKNWNWIDTLAAACAEAGDFKRAVEFEDQALRTGKPTESDRKGMQERMLLYQRSHPFRDKL